MGVLHHPEEERRGSVLLAHCFTCSKDLHTMTRLASGLSEAGDAVLRFDFTGIGESGEDFADKTVTRTVTDLRAGRNTAAAARLRAMRHRRPQPRWRGDTPAAARLRTVASVVVIGAPSSPEHVRSLLAGSETLIRQEGVAMVEIAG